MESRGLIEFQYLDGRVVSGDYEDHAVRYLGRGDTFQADDADWVMYDRVDRDGVTVFLCRPAS